MGNFTACFTISQAVVCSQSAFGSIVEGVGDNNRRVGSDILAAVIGSNAGNCYCFITNKTAQGSNGKRTGIGCSIVMPVGQRRCGNAQGLWRDVSVVVFMVSRL